MTKKRKTPSLSISKHPHFCKALREAIKDEEQGANYYRKMKTKVRCSSMKKKFQSMANDERRHKKTLNEMKRRFC